MKRIKPFWQAVRQWNDRFFERMGVDVTVIETSTSNLKHFLGDAKIVAAENCDGYQIATYETDDRGYCVVSAGGECVIYIAQYSQPSQPPTSQPPTVKPAKRLLTAQDLFGDI